MRQAGRHFLQIPGPSAVPDRILKAIGQSIGLCDVRFGLNRAPLIDMRQPQSQECLIRYGIPLMVRSDHFQQFLCLWEFRLRVQ